MRSESENKIARDLIKNRIPMDFGKSFEDLKDDIQKNYRASGYGCSDHFKSKAGYAVSFTDNINYQQGIKNGGGAGYYAHLRGVGTTSTIKLEGVR